MRFQSYFNTAVLLIRQYDGAVPLAHFLRAYFAQQKKHGSNDRKSIAQLCFHYYRIGHLLKENSVEERLKIALFLCNSAAGEWNILFDEEWLANWSRAVEERIDYIQILYPAFSLNDLFPWTGALSDGIDQKAFALSHLIQPDLFLRIRPGNEKKVLHQLFDHKISFEQLSPTCLALPNASKIDNVLEIDKEVVIQDYSSQRIAELLQLITYNLTLRTPIWDCCAASGGKSILAKDVLPNIHLTVSDIRPSILKNLHQRFKSAGISAYHSFVADLTNYKPQTTNHKLIICDAPCTGSGTWGRTPEQLYFFSEEKIDEYAMLQQKIVRNIVSGIVAGGYLLYITCSVFKKENEEMVGMMEGELGLKLVRAQLFRGYEMRGDSMYAGLFLRG